MVEIYKVLKYAIKHADISLLKYIIAHLYFYFAGLKSKNYTSKILYFWRLIVIKVYNLVLQQAVFVNRLINNHKELNSFFKAN